MGVVAGDFDGSGRLSLFVANDEDANFYFVNKTAEPGRDAEVRRARRAGSGLALRRRRARRWPAWAWPPATPTATASSICSSRISTMSPTRSTCKSAGGMFIDAHVGSGLAQPSYHMLGFGAQFLDGELDGVPDLVVTNGHIEDLSHHEVPFHMPPQYFRGLGGGKFAEVPAARTGRILPRQVSGPRAGAARLESGRSRGFRRLAPRCAGRACRQYFRQDRSLSSRATPRREILARRHRGEGDDRNGRPPPHPVAYGRRWIPGEQRARIDLRTRGGNSRRTNRDPLALGIEPRIRRFGGRSNPDSYRRGASSRAFAAALGAIIGLRAFATPWRAATAFQSRKCPRT